jgi:hypothetical protein
MTDQDTVFPIAFDAAFGVVGNGVVISVPYDSSGNIVYNSGTINNMSDLELKNNQTAAVEAELPRDLSQASSVTYHIGGEIDSTITVTIHDEDANLVLIRIDEVNLVPGFYNAEFEITFTDGSIEELPRDSYETVWVQESLD